MGHRSVLGVRALMRRMILCLMLVLTAAMFGVSCDAFKPSRPTAPRAQPTPTPTLAIGPAFGFTERVDLDAFAPRGRGRDLVIMNCDYCHSWVCAVRGQRTLDHWVMVEDVHLGRGWVILSDEEWNTLFMYLESNFNDREPEPKLPAALKDAGCTHSTYR